MSKQKINYKDKLQTTLPFIFLSALIAPSCGEKLDQGQPLDLGTKLDQGCSENGEKLDQCQPLDLGIKLDQNVDKDLPNNFDQNPDTPVDITFMKDYSNKCHSISEIPKAEQPFNNETVVNEVIIENADFLFLENKCGLSNSINENRGVFNMVYGRLKNSDIEQLFFLVNNYNPNLRSRYTSHILTVNPLEPEDFVCSLIEENEKITAFSKAVSMSKIYNNNLIFSLEKIDRTNNEDIDQSNNQNKVGWYTSSWNGSIYFDQKYSIIDYFPNNNQTQSILNIVTPMGQILSNYNGNILSIDLEKRDLNWVVQKEKLDLFKIFLDENNSYITEDDTINVRAINNNGKEVTLSINHCGNYEIKDSYVNPNNFVCFDENCIDVVTLTNSDSNLRVDIFQNSIKIDQILCDDFLLITESDFVCLDEIATNRLNYTNLTIYNLKNHTKKLLKINNSEQGNSKQYHSSIATSSSVFIVKEILFNKDSTKKISFSFISKDGVLLKNTELDISSETISSSNLGIDFLMTDKGTIFFTHARNVYQIKTNLKNVSGRRFSRRFGFNNRNNAQPSY